MSQVAQLLRAVRSGFMLAGLLTCSCGGSSILGSGSGGGAGNAAGGGGGSGGGGVMRMVLPKDRELTCPGPHYPDAGSGYTGSCCEHLVCRAPTSTGCPVGNDGRSYGSGSCLCGEAPSIKGPFTIADDDPRFATERAAGPCCYITTSVSCEGRPLHVAEAIRVAPVVVRGDWC